MHKQSSHQTRRKVRCSGKSYTKYKKKEIVRNSAIGEHGEDIYMKKK